jgi:hypothetical protein
MDKVTQQNAANAEESASASEELSAQAESMNEVVAQLTALVGGTTSGVSPSRQRLGRDRKQTEGDRHEKSSSDEGAQVHRFGRSDEAFHRIATQPQSESSHSILLGDEDDPDHFNA